MGNFCSLDENDCNGQAANTCSPSDVCLKDLCDSDKCVQWDLCGVDACGFNACELKDECTEDDICGLTNSCEEEDIDCGVGDG